MSVLTDLLVAGEDEAPAVAAAAQPLDWWPGVDTLGHGEVTLGGLWCILRGTPLRAGEYAEFHRLAGASPRGPKVVAVPTDLVVRLAALDLSWLPAVAARWSYTEGMQSVGRDRVELLLREYRLLAQKALAAGKALLLWVSL